MSTSSSLLPGLAWRTSFVVYGGNEDNIHLHWQLVPKMVEVEPDIVFSTGDIVANASGGEWRSAFFAPAQQLIQSAPLFIAIGELEQNSPRFYQLVSQPEPENYYSFSYGNSFFVVLDSNPESSVNVSVTL